MTHNLNLPYIAAAQAQKHVTHNEALRALDAIVQLSVLDQDLTAPPGSPTDGDRYIVAASATGTWAGKDNQVAAWQDGAWAFYVPKEGWLAWVADEDGLVVWDGSSWASTSGGSVSLNPATGGLVGVNATADTTNRLAVSSAASLFNHAGNGHQQKINKAAAGDTASQLYQTNFSGRAEIGLTGDDDFHFKVSPDGSTFREAIVIDKDDGSVSLPNTPSIATDVFFNLLEDGGRFGPNPEDQTYTVGAYAAPSYLISFNGATFAQGDKFIFNNSTHGGAAGALGSDVDGLIQKLKSTTNARRYGPEFYLLEITVGSGTSSSTTIGAQTHYLVATVPLAPMWARSTFVYNIKCSSGRIGIRMSSYGDMYLDGAKMTAATEILPADGWVQVVSVMTTDPTTYVGYNNGVLNLVGQSGAEAVLGLPCLFPGKLIPTATPFGVIPSLRAWRA